MVTLASGETVTLDRLTDDDDDDQSSCSDAYDDGDFLAAAMDDDVTAQLAAAGWQIKQFDGDFSFLFAYPLPLYSPVPSIILYSSLGALFLPEKILGFFFSMKITKMLKGQFVYLRCSDVV